MKESAGKFNGGAVAAMQEYMRRKLRREMVNVRDIQR